MRKISILLCVGVTFCFATSSFAQKPICTPVSLDRAQFQAESFSYFKKMQARATLRFQKSIQQSEQKCPAAHKKLTGVVHKLLSGSKLPYLENGLPALQIAVLCSKTNMPPIARIIGGNLLLIPISLAEQSDSEGTIAAVLAHELAHFTLHHHVRLYEELHLKKNTTSLIHRTQQQIKAEHEKEADLAGLQIMVNAGYDPASALLHLKKVSGLVHPSKKPTVHEPYENRMATLANQIRKCGYDSPLVASFSLVKQ